MTFITTLLKRNLMLKYYLLTQIDNLTYEIKSEDAYEELFKHKHLFDFSNYPKGSKLFDLTNEKVIAKMKDVRRKYLKEK